MWSPDCEAVTLEVAGAAGARVGAGVERWSPGICRLVAVGAAVDVGVRVGAGGRVGFGFGVGLPVGGARRDTPESPPLAGAVAASTRAPKRTATATAATIDANLDAFLLGIVATAPNDRRTRSSCR